MNKNKGFLSYYLKDYKIDIILGPLFKLFEAIIELTLPLIISYIINYGILGDLPNKNQIIIKYGILLVLLSIIGFFTTLICQYFASRCASSLQYRLKDDFYNKIMSLDRKQLDKYNTSILITRFNTDIQNITNSVLMAIRLGIRVPFLIIGSIVISFTINKFVALIFLIISILIVSFVLVIMKVIVNKQKKVLSYVDNATEKAKEDIQGIRAIKSFNKEDDEINSFTNILKNIKKSQDKVSVISSFLNPYSLVLINITIILILYLFKNNIGSSFNVGNLVALINYLNQILVAILVLCNLIVIFAKAKTSKVRLKEIFDIKIEDNRIYDSVCKTNIVYEFVDVSFKYDMTSYVLKDMNFKILKGQKVGVIGKTASGKSTFAYLLANLYNTTNGVIKFYDKDISLYKNDCITNNITLTFQKPKLFYTTIKENITLNKPYSLEKLNNVLNISNAIDVINKDELGINKVILPGNKNISGGEAQRISIARSLFKDTDVIIFDDSFSALDFKTEKKIVNDILKLNNTVIIITQRISTILNTDFNIVLDDSKIESIGAHEELINKSNLYKDIYNTYKRGDTNE